MNPRYSGWSRAGFAYNHQLEITNAYKVVPLTTDTTNAPRSQGPPSTSWLEDFCAELDTVATGVTIFFYLCRDADGDRPLTPEASQTIQAGKTTANRGGVNFKIERDYHNEGIAAVDIADTIHVAIKLNAGTANGNLRLNWKA